jgi:DNA helicase HerA-like ATPase
VTGGASSPDGRTIAVTTGGSGAAAPGDIVLLRSGDTTYVGQVLEPQTTGSDGVERSTGLLVGAMRPDGTVDRSARAPFADASVGPAAAETLEALQAAVGATLPIGTWSPSGVTVPARLRPQGFGRHTFLCGQSGSGKTYALGVLLEQLLLGTDLRMVVLDPNADYVRLGTPRPDAPADLAQRLAATDVRVLAADGADREGSEPLRMRFMTMPVAARAALLRLDPLRDRDEYNHFLHLSDSSGSTKGIEDLVHHMRERGGTGEALAQRIENLGLLDWEVWAGERRSAWEVVESGPRMTVLDLSGFRDPHEPVAASLDLIERLWQQRETRTPTLLVIDEAHNVCPAQPAGPAQGALVERLVQIAAEGRKYGLWLLLSTQRPSKIHPQVLSQCDNLVLMRMNSPGDVAELAGVFGFAPPAMLQSSRFFTQGEALVAGGFVPAPAIIRMGARLTHEGGGDVRVPVR